MSNDRARIYFSIENMFCLWRAWWWLAGAAEGVVLRRKLSLGPCWQLTHVKPGNYYQYESQLAEGCLFSKITYEGGSFYITNWGLYFVLMSHISTAPVLIVRIVGVRVYDVRWYGAKLGVVLKWYFDEHTRYLIIVDFSTKNLGFIKEFGYFNYTLLHFRNFVIIMSWVGKKTQKCLIYQKNPTFGSPI